MSSRKTGVYYATRKDKTEYFRASITYNKKHISLGSFDSEEDAHLCYKEAEKLLYDKSLSIDTFSTHSHLSFEKWVVLCNFRDNGIYFANPIYVRPRFFYYYFTPTHFFIFSKEDLFYYSAHKIQRRGGHYFMSDYGSQVNLMSRYGIKSHAVEGRDYVFRNGNSQDMQYGNIHVYNSFHGVIIINDGACEKPRYKARIHINGYTQIGIFDTAIKAAIAYNKAIDYLQKIGISKQYPTNYIDGLSAMAYADIYSSVILPDSIISLRNL